MLRSYVWPPGVCNLAELVLRNSMPVKPTKPTASKRKFRVYHLGQRGELLGTVMAANPEEALEVAMEKFRIPERDRPRTLVREAE
jgi:hypothetical protein